MFLFSPLTQVFWDQLLGRTCAKIDKDRNDMGHMRYIPGFVHILIISLSIFPLDKPSLRLLGMISCVSRCLRSKSKYFLYVWTWEQKVFSGSPTIVMIVSIRGKSMLGMGGKLLGRLMIDLLSSNLRSRHDTTVFGRNVTLFSPSTRSLTFHGDLSCPIMILKTCDLRKELPIRVRLTNCWWVPFKVVMKGCCGIVWWCLSYVITIHIYIYTQFYVRAYHHIPFWSISESCQLCWRLFVFKVLPLRYFWACSSSFWVTRGWNEWTNDHYEPVQLVGQTSPFRPLPPRPMMGKSFGKGWEGRSRVLRSKTQRGESPRDWSGLEFRGLIVDFPLKVSGFCPQNDGFFCFIGGSKLSAHTFLSWEKAWTLERSEAFAKM